MKVFLFVCRAITLFKIVESGAPWYGSIQLVEMHRMIQGVPNSTILNKVIARWYHGLAVPWGVPFLFDASKFFVISNVKLVSDLIFLINSISSFEFLFVFSPFYVVLRNKHCIYIVQGLNDGTNVNYV